MRLGDWVYCPQGVGYEHESGVVSKRLRQFDKQSVGQICEIRIDCIISVWLVRSDTIWDVVTKDVKILNVGKTGDKFDNKICNVCHCLLAVGKFSLNQNNLHGEVRRPSCKKCRADIDKRPAKTRQAKEFAKNRPKKGSRFKCPICQRRSIVGVTARIVADHDHNTGNIRDFICESCNTGLGRFKNGENYLLNAIQYLKERDSF